MPVKCLVLKPGDFRPSVYRFTTVPKKGDIISFLGGLEEFEVAEVQHFARSPEWKLRHAGAKVTLMHVPAESQMEPIGFIHFPYTPAVSTACFDAEKLLRRKTPQQKPALPKVEVANMPMKLPARLPPRKPVYRPRRRG